MIRNIFSSAFIFCAALSIAQNPSASFSNWKNNAKGAYSIIHDDFGAGTVSGIENYADTIAYNRGVKITFGAITSECTSSDWINARRMISHGHEIMNHTHNHRCAYDPGWCETGLWENYEVELDTSTNQINRNTNVYPRFFIWPYDLHTPESKAYLKDELNYYGARGGVQDQTLNANQLTSHTHQDLFSINFSVFAPTTNLSELNSLVDLAISQGKWGMRELHGVGDASWGSVPVANYRTHINYVKTKIASGDLWNANASEVTTYLMQTRSFTPVTSYSAANSKITISFNQTQPLDVSDLRSDVTLNVNIAGLTSYVYAFQAGKELTTKLNGNVLSMNCFPHKGPIELYNVKAGAAVVNSPTAGAKFLPNASISLGVNLSQITTPIQSVTYNIKYGNTVVASVVGSGNNFAATWSTAAAGSYTVSASVVPVSGPTITTNEIAFTVAPADNQVPYLGQIISIPGKIEAENFDKGGQNISYNETSNTNEGGASYRTEPVDIEVCLEGGFNISYVATGEWLEYSINVAQAGLYDISFRTATTFAGKTIQLLSNGSTIINSVTLPNTGNWQTFATTTVKNVSLQAGVQVLRLNFTSNDINVNYIDITSPVTAAEFIQTKDFEIFPNPTQSGLHIHGSKMLEVEVFDISGNRITSVINTSNTDELHLDVGDLVPGFYWLKIKGPNNSVTTRFSKM